MNGIRNGTRRKPRKASGHMAVIQVFRLSGPSCPLVLYSKHFSSPPLSLGFLFFSLPVSLPLPLSGQAETLALADWILMPAIYYSSFLNFCLLCKRRISNTFSRQC